MQEKTILATFLLDKLDTWIRRVGLADDVEKLKSEIRRVKMVISAVKTSGIGNEPLAESLAILKELLYEAEDVVDELDYYRLQQQVEAVDDPQGEHAAYQADNASAGISGMQSSRGKKRRSKAWNFFDVIEEENGEPIKARCKYCLTQVKCGTLNGTSAMLNHNMICKNKPGPNDQPPNLTNKAGAKANARTLVISDSPSRKRRRGHEEREKIITSNTCIPCDKDELSNRLRKLTSQIQDTRGEVSEGLKLHGSDSASSSNHRQHTTAQKQLRTSSLVPRKVWGRDTEKNSIVKLIMAADRSDSVTILPLVGIVGVGKTTLAQLIYNEPYVQKTFYHKIWVWVSHNFDEVRVTRDMLDFVSPERHEEINCFAKLQEMLKSHANSKKFLLILDDVWDDMNDFRWEKVLAPLVSNHVKGNVILVTTRNLSVAQRLSALEPVKVGALGNDDFWLFFKSRAFGENCKEHQSLSIVGREIAEKLKGNPLAAESTGELLRKKLDTDYWRHILKNEDWKSMQLSRGIMPALKLSYDQLPYHLQQCFSYCSIFPYSYRFLGEELVGFWIAQRFVKCSNTSQSLEGIGRHYLIDLVNLGFLQEIKMEEPYLGSQVMYALCGIMHDLAMMLSRTECANIDGVQCNKTPLTIRHLSIITSSAYGKDEHGNIPRNERFEENLKSTVTSVSKLRTLVLIGNYDSFFLLLFQDIFQKAHNLRVLQMSATSTDYLQHGYDKVDGSFPRVLRNLYHLQILDVGLYTDATTPDGINNLLSLRHLVVHKGVYTSIATMGNITTLHELHDFKFEISISFKITHSQCPREPVQDWAHQLDNVKTLSEVYEALLEKNELLEVLHLSRKESSVETVGELLPIDESDPSSKCSMNTPREVLVENLEPRQGVNVFEIWYNGATSPIGLTSNLTVISLQSLHLYCCGEWLRYPTLERFPFLKTLKLSNLPKVTEVLVPSLEELVLVEMPKLERCSCTSVKGLYLSLRVLQIEKCHALKVFDLLENHDEFGIQRNTWLHCLRKLTMRDCPLLKVLNGLPLSNTFCEFLMTGVPTLPRMQGSIDAYHQNLYFGYYRENEFECSGGLFDESSDELRILDEKMLPFSNLDDLSLMRIDGCRNLMSISFRSFRHLFSLRELELFRCEKLFTSQVLLEHTSEDMTDRNCEAFPSLMFLGIMSCGIAGNWLSRMLRHAPNLRSLRLDDCPNLTLLSIEEEEQDEENSLPNICTAREEQLQIPLNLLCSFDIIYIEDCPSLTFKRSKKGFSAFTSLAYLTIYHCCDLLSSLVHKDENDDMGTGIWLLPTSLVDLRISEYCQETLRPCFPTDLTRLKTLEVGNSYVLESLRLQSCTVLEELIIKNCESLTTVEGLQYPGSLRHLTVYCCPGLSECLESFARQGYGLCSRLETLKINDPSILTTSLCKRLSSLKRLQVRYLMLAHSPEQGRALVCLKALQQLEFCSCSLVDLPAGLHTFPSLKRLKIKSCPHISRLPDTNLPLSLEELEIVDCSKELADQCVLLATNKLNVKISRCL